MQSFNNKTDKRLKLFWNKYKICCQKKVEAFMGENHVDYLEIKKNEQNSSLGSTKS